MIAHLIRTISNHDVHAGTATGAGLGGAFLAQVTQSPDITFGTIVLALVGLLSLWVRSYYGLKRDQLEVDRLKGELDGYRRRDTEALKARLTTTATVPTMPASALAFPHSEGS